MEYKSIKNEQWEIKRLISKILNGEVNKPKCQRKKKWTIIPEKNDNKPSERKFYEKILMI